MITNLEKTKVLDAVQSSIFRNIVNLARLFKFNDAECFAEIQEYVSDLYDKKELKFKKISDFVCTNVMNSYACGSGNSPLTHFIFHSPFSGFSASESIIGVDASFLFIEHNKNKELHLDDQYLKDRITIVNPVDDIIKGQVTFTLPANHFANYLSPEDYDEMILFLNKFDFVPRLSIDVYIFSEDSTRKIVTKVTEVISKYISSYNKGDE